MPAPVALPATLLPWGELPATGEAAIAMDQQTPWYHRPPDQQTLWYHRPPREGDTLPSTRQPMLETSTAHGHAQRVHNQTTSAAAPLLHQRSAKDHHCCTNATRYTLHATPRNKHCCTTAAPTLHQETNAAAPLLHQRCTKDHCRCKSLRKHQRFHPAKHKRERHGC